MKLLGWALVALFVVWLSAFVGIKIYDLGCVTHPSICVTETGIWLRKLVLLEWASKWQTLLAGAGAIVGGAFVLIAGREQISHIQNTKRRERLDQALDSFYAIGTPISDYFQNITRKNSSTLPNPLPVLDHAMMRDLIYISPQLAQHYVRVQGHTASYDRRSFQNKTYQTSAQKFMIGYSYCLFQMFRQIAIAAKEEAKFFPRIHLDDFKFDSDSLQKVAARHELEKVHIGRFSKFFILTTTANESD